MQLLLPMRLWPTGGPPGGFVMLYSSLHHWQHRSIIIDWAGKTIDDTSNIEDFITPVKLPQAAEAIVGADKIHYL